jgi:hypothetical protein
LDVAAKFGIKLPFKEIISTAHGRSVCEQCGAAYAGYQPLCDRHVRFVILQERYGSSELYSETANIGDRLCNNRYGDYYPVVSAKYDSCKGNLKWDLQAEFERQQRFFRLLEYIASSDQHNPFDEFSDCFLPGVQQHLEVRLTKTAVDILNTTIERHHSAIEEIAQKMQLAGQSLCF